MVDLAKSLARFHLEDVSGLMTKNAGHNAGEDNENRRILRKEQKTGYDVMEN